MTSPSSELIEYRVRPVTRFIITRFEQDGAGAGTCGRGEYDNAETAYEVAYALAKADHERKGWPLDDPRIQYPRHPDEENGVREVSSQEFSVPVENVLDGARDLIEVAVIGIDGDGIVQVASSIGTPQTLALFERARSRIDEIAGEN